jgi:hypothetical protein
MNFSVEEENLICMYHTSDRRRTMARMLAALPDMDTEMRRLVNGTIAKLELTLTDRGLISRVSDTASLTTTHYFQSK